MIISGNCPICESSINPLEDVEVSEILSCPDCQSALVVESIGGSDIQFEQAPLIEEDWGE